MPGARSRRRAGRERPAPPVYRGSSRRPRAYSPTRTRWMSLTPSTTWRNFASRRSRPTVYSSDAPYAVDLDRVRRRPKRHLRSVELGDRLAPRAPHPLGFQPGQAVGQVPGRLDPEHHVGDLRLHELVARDGLALDDALARVPHRGVETRLGEPHRAAGHGEAPVLHGAEGDPCSPSRPIRFSAGTRQSSKTSSPTWAGGTRACCESAAR